MRRFGAIRAAGAASAVRADDDLDRDCADGDLVGVLGPGLHINRAADEHGGAGAWCAAGCDAGSGSAEFHRIASVTGLGGWGGATAVRGTH
jgi:hypothetical protein